MHQLNPMAGEMPHELAKVTEIHRTAGVFHDDQSPSLIQVVLDPPGPADHCSALVRGTRKMLRELHEQGFGAARPRRVDQVKNVGHGSGPPGPALPASETEELQYNRLEVIEIVRETEAAKFVPRIPGSACGPVSRL